MMVSAMVEHPSSPPIKPLVIVAGDGFSGWHALNDTVMGGQSSGGCSISNKGLVMDAEVIEAGGGFVSCRSPKFSPPLDLSGYSGLQIDLRADGRRYKLALACADGLGGLTELIPGGLRWVAEFGTESDGLTQVTIPFASLKASVRARPRQRPWAFDACRITRLQVLHSKFSDDGGLNTGFRPGALHLSLEAIRAVP